MAAEPGRTPETLDLRHRAEDRLVIGGRLVKAGPRRLDPRACKRRRTTCGLLEHLLEELPVHVGGVARALRTVAHADQHPFALRVEVERRLEIDGHRAVARNRRKCPCDGDVAPAWKDR